MKKTTYEDIEPVRSLLTEQPEYWEHDITEREVLAVFSKKKERGTRSKLVRYQTMKRMYEFSNITLAHYFRLVFLNSQVKVGADEFILDIGCGEADFKEILYRNMKHANYVGIELSTKALESALTKKSRHPYMFIQKDINTGIPLKDKSFDRIICTEFIEHISKESGDYLLKEANRVLKDDGVFYLSTPDKTLAEGIYANDHIHEYEYQEILDSLSDNGFEVINQYGCSSKSKHIKKALTEEESILYSKFREYSPASILNQVFSITHPAECYDRIYICRSKK